MVQLNDTLIDALEKYYNYFKGMQLQIHTVDCHSEFIHFTFWYHSENNIDIFPEIFCYNVATKKGSWEIPEFDPDCDETYERGYLDSCKAEKTIMLQELNRQLEKIEQDYLNET